MKVFYLWLQAIALTVLAVLLSILYIILVPFMASLSIVCMCNPTITIVRLLKEIPAMWSDNFKLWKMVIEGKDIWN